MDQLMDTVKDALIKTLSNYRFLSSLITYCFSKKISKKKHIRIKEDLDRTLCDEYGFNKSQIDMFFEHVESTRNWLSYVALDACSCLSYTDFRDPPNLEGEIQTVNDVRMYYYPDRMEDQFNLIDWSVKSFEVHDTNEITLLDIGCGYGYFGRLFEKANKGRLVKYVGMDKRMSSFPRYSIELESVRSIEMIDGSYPDSLGSYLITEVTTVFLGEFVHLGFDLSYVLEELFRRLKHLTQVFVMEFIYGSTLDICFDAHMCTHTDKGRRIKLKDMIEAATDNKLTLAAKKPSVYHVMGVFTKKKI